MTQPFRPSAVQRRILASLLHLISTEAVRLRALGVTVAPTVTVSDIYTDLASDKGRPAPIQRVIADELGAVPGVEKVKPSIEITDAVWSMMGTLPPSRVAGEPAPPPPPPPSTHTHPRLPGESGTQLFHRLLNAHPDGLTARQMRVMSGVDLASVASTEKTAGRVRFSQAEPRAATVFQPLRDPRQPAVEAVAFVEPLAPPAEYSPQKPAEHVWIVEPENADADAPVAICGTRSTYLGTALECRMPANHEGSHFDEVQRTAWESDDEIATWPAPENADDARPDVAPTLDASPDVGPATAEGGDTSAVAVVVSESWDIVPTLDLVWEEVAPRPEPLALLGEDREPCPPIKVYVATSLDHAHRAVAVHEALEHAGHIITYKWTDHGSVQGEGVARLREVAAAELQGVREADVLVAILPGGRGTHAEIGIAIGLGIPVVLLEQVGTYDAECAFYHAPGVHRWMWAEESVLPLLSMWAEHVWRASLGPGASRSVPYQMLLANIEIADMEHALDEVRATCVGVGIPSETTDEATGTSTWWPTAALVRRLAEREAMHVDALEQARFDLSLVRDTCISAGIPGECVDAEGNTLPWGVPALVRMLAEREAMRVDARTEAESAARTHLNEVEQLKGRVADLEERSVAVDARAAEQRAKLAAALGLQADAARTWNHLLTEALAVRSERDATRGERYDFAKAVCAALGKEDRTVDDVGPDFARTLVLEWVAKDARAYSAASTDRWDKLEALRGMVADVAAAIGLADHDRTANPFATRVVVLESLRQLRAKLAAALGLNADPEWTWGRLLDEAAVLHGAHNQWMRDAEAASAAGEADHAAIHALCAQAGISDSVTMEDGAVVLRPAMARLQELARLAQRVRRAERESEAVEQARQILMDALDSDTSPASLRSGPGEAAIIGVARMAAAQLAHHRLPLAQQLAACREALVERIGVLDIAADLLGVA